MSLQSLHISEKDLEWYPISGLYGGGYPISGLYGGYPISGLYGGVPIPGPDQGGTLSQVQTRGVPHPRSIPGEYLILLMGEGYPIKDQDWMGYPPGQDWMGYPLSKTGWGKPPPHPRLTSTCYAAGGMPLAFTQKEFLVVIIINGPVPCPLPLPCSVNKPLH